MLQYLNFVAQNFSLQFQFLFFRFTLSLGCIKSLLANFLFNLFRGCEGNWPRYLTSSSIEIFSVFLFNLSLGLHSCLFYKFNFSFIFLFINLFLSFFLTCPLDALVFVLQIQLYYFSNLFVLTNLFDEFMFYALFLYSCLTNINFNFLKTFPNFIWSF